MTTTTLRNTRARLAVALALLASIRGEAHKPITSKYTFTEHVLPIFRDRCIGCHLEGGAAPMALTTYADARPWAESIRAELVAAHMPPAQAETGLGSFRNARLLPPRDLDVVLTWATGGTPEGPPLTAPPLAPVRADWPLGPPDITIPVPAPVTLAPGQVEFTEEFRLDAGALQDRGIRAIDLSPGTPAIVRRAIFLVGTRPAAPPAAVDRDTVAGIWSPDRGTTIAAKNAAFWFPRGAEFDVRITYRKTWKYENTAMTDRSTVGVYFADASAGERRIEAIDVVGTRTLDEDVQAVAVRSRMEVEEGDVRATAVMPDGSRSLLVRFTAQREWPQRFWYDSPVALPRGTRIESSVPITLDVVRARR